MQNEKTSLRRLEDSRWESEAGGLRNLPWKTDADNPLAPPVLDIDWLGAQPLLPILVEVVPAHTLYRSLSARGLEDCLEVIEWLRGDQLQKVLDFDVWVDAPTLGTRDIAPDRVFDWLRVWLEIGPEFAAERVLELEEETLVSLLSGVFDIQPEGFVVTAENLPDDWVTTPDRRYHLKLKVSGEENFEIAHQVVQAMYGRDVRLASRVFAYAAMLIRQESLEDAVRWRNGRLADQGFVDPQEARSALRPRPADKLSEAVRAHARREQAKELDVAERRRKFAKTEAAFMADLEPETVDAVAALLRGMDPTLAMRYISALLPEDEIRRLTGGVIDDADRILEDDEVVVEATERAILEARSLLSRAYGINLRSESADALLVERAVAALAERRPDAVFDIKSRMARVSNTLAAALSPEDFLASESFARALGVVRGALNMGLEVVLAAPTEYGLILDATEFDEVRAAHALEIVGPEFLFQLGWQPLARLPIEFAEALVALEASSPVEFGFLATTRAMKSDDGAVTEVGLDILARSGRYGDVRRWLDAAEPAMAAPAFWILNAVLNRVPLFPVAFESPVRTLRPFAHLSELALVRKFAASLSSNLKG